MSHPAPGKGQGKGRQGKGRQGKGRQGKGRPSKGWMPRGALLLRHLQGMQPSSIPRLVTWDDLGRLDLNGFDEEDTGGIRILRCNRDQLGFNENDWTMKQYRWFQRPMQNHLVINYDYDCRIAVERNISNRWKLLWDVRGSIFWLGWWNHVAGYWVLERWLEWNFQQKQRGSDIV